MSVERFVITQVVEEGTDSLRKLYVEGINNKDFAYFEEEFKWIERQLSTRQLVNRRRFTQRFPDFEWTPTNEPLVDLVRELKNEKALTEVNLLLSEVAQTLEVGNAIEVANKARERLSEISRMHSPRSDERMTHDWQDHLLEMRQMMALAKNGLTIGIPTDVPHLDYHWNGLENGNMIVILGRPGEGKSYLLMQFAWAAKKRAYNVGLFSPELGQKQNRFRLHTLASADEVVQQAIGIDRSFRNRNLMRGNGFNLKAYQRLLEYLDQQPGEIHLLTQRFRREKMSIAYIEDRIQELGLNLVLIDPIYKLKPVRRYDNPTYELAALSDAVEDLAETYDVPVVITNQAHRQGTNKGDAPHKDSSFNSDVPIQEADYVLGVRHFSEENKMVCRCTKSRWGGEFRFDMRFFANTGILYPISPIHGNYEDVGNPELEQEARRLIDSATGRESDGD